MEYLQTALAFIVLVGALVFIHELGHFLAARWTGMRADIFAVGMGPRLFGWNRRTGFSFGKLPEGLELEGATDYRIAAFPVGGYVKILGMVDESMDTDFTNRPPEPWEFRSKSTLQKAIVISAGVIMNFLLAIALFGMLNYVKGKDLYATTTIGPLPSPGPASEAGLREGDRITAINGAPVKYFDDIRTKIYLEDADNDITIQADRAGTPVTVKIPRSKISTDAKDGYVIPLPEKVAVAVSSVVKGTPAEKAGLLPNDTLLAADATPIHNVVEFKKYVTENKGKSVALSIKRNGTQITQQVTPDSGGTIGVQIGDAYYGPVKHVGYGFFEAIGSGWNQTVLMTTGTFGLVGKLFQGKAKVGESFGGPQTIAKYAKESASRGLPEFLSLMAVLSVSLACMNILPIPALDGGHLVFIMIEGIIRREVPVKIRMAVQQVGFALLIIFMAYVTINDVMK